MGLLKRTENGYFSLLPMAQAEDREELCHDCGVSDCPVRYIAHRLRVNRMNAIVAVKSCKSFIPVLDFKDPGGTMGLFNTFRVGSAWMQRLSIGDIVGLRTESEIFGRAKVKDLHNGPFCDMNTRFGLDNHLAIQADVDGKDFDLGQVMRNLYGTNRFDEDRVVTVIYLERLHD